LDIQERNNIMKKFLKYSLLLFLTAISCKTTQKVTSFEEILYPNGTKPQAAAQLDEMNARWFDYYFMEAIKLKTTGEYGKAAMYYAEAIKSDPSCATCYYELANLLYYSGDVKNAMDNAFKAVQLDPENEWFVLFLSRVLHQNKKIGLALSSAKYLVDLKPNNIEYIYNLAQMQLSAKQYHEAVQTLTKIEKILGKNEQLNIEKYSIYSEAKDYKNAEKELKKLIKDYPSNLDYVVYLGDFYAQTKNSKKALEQYKKVIDKDPKNGPLNFSLANYYLILKDTVNFKKYLISGFENTNITIEDKLQRLLPFIINLNDPQNPLKNKDIETVFTQLIKVHKDEVKVYVLYGNFLNITQQRKKATETFETALLIDEKQEEVWQDFLYLAFGEYDKDVYLEKCKIAVNAFPENAIFHYLIHYFFAIQIYRFQIHSDI